MKTDDLIDMLTRGAEPVVPARTGQRFGLALAASVPAAAILMLMVLGLRADLAAALATPMGLAKPALTLLAAAGGWLACARLSRPGAGPGGAFVFAIAALLLVGGGALAALLPADPATRLAMVFGRTWRVCPLNILMLSLPVFVAAIVTMRGLAPTRLRLAGAAAGLFAGAAGASVYTLHCPEDAMPFLAVWYVLGIVATTGVGALLGPRLLRW